MSTCQNTEHHLMGIEQIKSLPCNSQKSTCQNTEHHVMGIEQIK
jgi:hypothetical protein